MEEKDRDLEEKNRELREKDRELDENRREFESVKRQLEERNRDLNEKLEVSEISGNTLHTQVKEVCAGQGTCLKQQVHTDQLPIVVMPTNS